MGGFLSSVSRAGAAISELLLLKSKRKPAEEARAIRQKARDAAQDAREAVARHDEDEVNRIIQRAEDRRGACLVAVPMALAVVALSVLLGCVRVQEKLVVVPADRKVAYMEVEGRPGWWVPDVTMGMLLANTARVAELEALREVWEERHGSQ